MCGRNFGSFGYIDCKLLVFKVKKTSVFAPRVIGLSRSRYEIEEKPKLFMPLRWN